MQRSRRLVIVKDKKEKYEKKGTRLAFHFSFLFFTTDVKRTTLELENRRELSVSFGKPETHEIGLPVKRSKVLVSFSGDFTGLAGRTSREICIVRVSNNPLF